MAEEIAENIEEPTGETTIASPTSINDLKPKMKVTGKVTRLELYGAFIDLGVDVNAILHISKINEKVNRISDAFKVGDEVTVWVEDVDPDRNQVTVTMLEPLAVEWSDLKEGQIYTGKVVRLEKFGAFVDIGAEKEGLIHVSELSHDFVKHPSEVVKVDDEVEVKVLGFNKRKRRIDLSRKSLLDAPESDVPVVTIEEIEEDEEEEVPTAMEIALRRAMGKSSGDPSGGKSGRKNNQREKLRAAQEDLLSRTLRQS
ncbi:MAG: S1 RNA-binding domain-containing protein [Candidatus Promineifilaceae bacterium]